VAPARAILLEGRASPVNMHGLTTAENGGPPGGSRIEGRRGLRGPGAADRNDDMGAIFGIVSFGGAVCDEGRARGAARIALPRGRCVAWLADGPRARIAVRGGAPGRSEDARGATVAFDGHLHARADLEASLPGPASDAALVARAWRRWGPSAPQHLHGDYAAAIHDPAENRLVLLRDHVGTRPLYWHWGGGVFSFATFLPVLLELLPERPAPDAVTVGAFLRWPLTLGERTFFAGVGSVMPGHMLTVDASGPRLTRWWTPEPTGMHAGRDPGALVDEFERICATAVSDRLGPAEAAVGAHLSGGIDSSAVTFLAQENLVREDRQLAAVYTWSPREVPSLPGDSPDDERRRVARLASHLGVDLRFGDVTGAERMAFLRRPIELEGIADLVDEVPILRAAEADGIAVLLSGWGGDEAFSAMAREWPAFLLANGRFGGLFRLARRNGGLRRPDRMAAYLYRAAIHPIAQATLLRHRHLERGLYRPGCYLSSALAANADAEAAVPRMVFGTDPVAGIADLFRFGHLGERMASWAAMGAGAGIDYRYPLTDRRLVEFMLGLAPEHLWADGAPRYFARALMKRRILDPFPKADPANEAHRMATRKACWTALAEAARAGVYDGSCDWLDMRRLRRDLARGPQGDDRRVTIEFARIVAALRVWHFAERCGAVEGRDATLAEPA
jgi:asparagine synthase (glutamine-hydrolysing)